MYHVQISEERGLSDLTEYAAPTQSDELDGVVTIDFMHKRIADNILSDPYFRPVFTSAFQMLSHLREPAYAATVRTFLGSLCEVERVIGDSLLTGHVGYNALRSGKVLPPKR